MGRRKQTSKKRINPKAPETVRPETTVPPAKPAGRLRRLESYCAAKAKEYKTIGGWALAILAGAWVLLDKFVLTDQSPPPIVSVYHESRDKLPESVQTLTPFRIYASLVLHPGPVFRVFERRNKEETDPLKHRFDILFSIDVRDTGTETILLVKVKDESTIRAFTIDEESFEPFSVHLATTGGRVFLISVDACRKRFPQVRVFSNVQSGEEGIGVQIYHPLGKSWTTKVAPGGTILGSSGK